MSLIQTFQGRAANANGLIKSAGFGPSLNDTGHYQQVMGRMALRRQRASALLGGQALAGQRVDSARPTAWADAERLARAAEWAEYLAEKFPTGKRADAYMPGGDAIVRSFVSQIYKDAPRFDATVPMASQGLTYILPEVYHIAHNDLPCWDGQFLDIWRGVDPAANEYVWYETDNVGLGLVANTYDVSSIPMVGGPLANDNKGLIVPALVGMETNFMDPRREAMAVSMGKPDFQVEIMKRQMCERTLAEFADALWFGGDASLGIDGLMNNPLVSTMTITGTWASKTALQILDDLRTMVYAIANRTAGQIGVEYGKITIMLPPTQFQRLMIPITAAGSTSVLEYFLGTFKESGRGVPKVVQEFRLAAANSYAYNGGPNILANDTALILYKDGNPNVDPTFVLSQPIEVPAPVRTTGVGDVTYFHLRCGGMKLPDARRIMYAVGL